MGQRQKRLRQLLENAGCEIGFSLVPLPKQMAEFRSGELNTEILHVYGQLEGELDEFPDGCGSWDIEIGSVAIELDEERHFNQYRNTTLSSRLYLQLPQFPLEIYCQFSSRHQSACLKAAGYGKNWTSPSCKKQFGPSSEIATLSAPGPARWKQRAFYDFLKDMVPIARDNQVARISIWDTVLVEGRELSIDCVLKWPDEKAVEAAPSLIALIEKRAGATIR